MAENLHFSLTGDLSLSPLWELQSPCCSAVDRLPSANLIWTQQMVQRESATKGWGGWGVGGPEEGVKVKTGADLKWLQRQRRSVFICSDVDWGVIFYHACASLSALIVCNKVPAKSLQLQERLWCHRKYAEINLDFIFLG